MEDLSSTVQDVKDVKESCNKTMVSAVAKVKSQNKTHVGEPVEEIRHGPWFLEL
jgi:hypothetical protein